MKGTASGLVVAGVAHLAGAEGRKGFLTIATDKQIHTLISTSNKGQNDVGLALEAAGNSVLHANGVTSQEPVSQSQPATEPPPAAERGAIVSNEATAGPTLAHRVRELADLHKDGILSDEEFASAKAKLLGSL